MPTGIIARCLLRFPFGVTKCVYLQDAYGDINFQAKDFLD